MPFPVLLCLVVAIADGDTLTARCGEEGAYEQVRVRISAIDAPESKQAFGTRSRQALADLCFRQDAKITDRGRDRWQRMIADVECQGQDVALYQVRLGMAWVYTQYARGYEWLLPHQEDAKANRRGLWSDPRPFSPWDYRADLARGRNALKAEDFGDAWPLEAETASLRCDRGVTPFLIIKGEDYSFGAMTRNQAPVVPVHMLRMQDGDRMPIDVLAERAMEHCRTVEQVNQDIRQRQ